MQYWYLFLFLAVLPSFASAQLPKRLTLAEAHDQYQQAVVRRDTPATAEAAYQLGKLYRGAGNYVSSRRWLLACLKLREPAGPSVELNRVYIQLVTTVPGDTDVNEAYHYACRALANSRRLKHPHSLMSSYNVLSGLYRGVAGGQISINGLVDRKACADSAAWYLQQAETIAVQLNNPLDLVSIRLAKASMLMGDKPRQAIPLLVYAQAFYKKQRSHHSALATNLLLTTAYTKLNQLPAARQCLMEAQSLSNQPEPIDTSQYAALQMGWSEWHQAAGHWQQALQHRLVADSLQDKLQFAGQRAQITQLNAAYEADRREADLKTERAENALQKSRLAEQQRYTLAALGLFLIAAGIGILFYRLSQENKRISQQNAQLREEQSHRFHNNLQAISGMLRLQSGRLTDAEARQAIDESRLRVQTIARLNQQLNAPDHLARLDLPTMIPDVVQAVLESYSYASIRPVYDLKPVSLPSDQLLPIVLIINELITNACKYAFPGNPAPMLRIRCWQERGELRLQVADNGLGMPPSVKANGFGLHLITLQVRQIGGHFTLSAPPGVTFDLSVGAKAKKHTTKPALPDESSLIHSDC